MARFRDRRVLSECMRHRPALRLRCSAKNAPVAQLDRALDYESRGQEFESLRARHFGIRYRHRTPPILHPLREVQLNVPEAEVRGRPS
jgi:hypothetical protein